MRRHCRHFGAECAAALGFDPNDVTEIQLHVDRIVVVTLWRNRDGKFKVNAAGSRPRRVFHVLTSVEAS